MRIWNYYGRSNFTGQDCFRNSGFKGTRETASQKEFVTAEKWWNFPAHEIIIQHMKVVGGASIRDTDPSDVNAFSKKPKWGVVDSLEALTPEWKRGIFVGICMMWQSVKTVQHSEKSVKSVTRKAISRTCVFGSAPKSSQRGSRVHLSGDELSDEAFGVERL